MCLNNYKKTALASKINFLNIYSVSRNNNKLLRVVLAALLVTATSTVLSDEFSKAYGTFYNEKENFPQVIKLTDSNGKITYTSSIPHEYIQVEKIAIAPPPSDDYIEYSRQRHDKLKTAAVELGAAREKRDAIREEKETKRLQRLALINQSRPPISYQRNVYVSYPYRLRKSHLHGAFHQTKKPVHFSNNGHRSSRLTLPSSSFSPTYKR